VALWQNVTMAEDEAKMVCLGKERARDRAEMERKRAQESN